MSEALEIERLRVVRETDAEQDRTRFDAHAGTAEAGEAEPGSLWLLLDRLFFAALGAVQGAAHGWANPSWARSDDDEEEAPAAALAAPVEALMTRTVQVIAPDAGLDEAARHLWDRDCGALPVVDGPGSRRVLGMITDRDLCMAAWSQGAPLHALRVRAVMSRDLRLCRLGDSIADVHRRMREGRVRRLPVLDAQGDLAGVVTVADLVRHALEAPPDVRGAAARAVLETLGTIGAPTRPAQPG